MCDCQDVVGFSAPRLVSIPDGAGKIGVGFFGPFSSRELEVSHLPAGLTWRWVRLIDGNRALYVCTWLV